MYDRSGRPRNVGLKENIDIKLTQAFKCELKPKLFKMMLSDLDLNILSRLVTQQVDHVTCIECCKYYTIPTTASCGHTLCHSCWRGRRNCASCGKQIEKKNLKLNIPLQTLREDVSILSNTFEDLFNIKLDEFFLDSPAEIIQEPNKNVKEWLASSQNQFSAPVTTSTQSTQEHIQTEQITSDIQIHTENNRLSEPREVVHVPPQQDDWDKIEEMPDAEKNTNKNQKNIVGPMDIEPFEFMMDDEEYTSCNPRRSSRQKDNKTNNPIINHDTSPQKNSENSNKDSEKKFHKVAKNWNNVKRMKKEFSKLNKQNRNKLNVSIEMCKRNVNIHKEVASITPEKLFAIDDNTPEIVTSTEHTDPGNNNDKMIKENESVNEHVNMNVNSNILKNTTNAINKTNENIADVNNKVAEAPQVAFFQKSSLQNKPLVITDNIQIEGEKPTTINTVNNDDIEITIKIGNTLANICIKKKNNDVQLNIKSDREIQTSLESCNFNKRQISSTIIDVNNLEHKNNSENILNTLSTPKVPVTQKSFSKKNTDSADTTTAQLEITENKEREMTKSLDSNDVSVKDTNKKNSVKQNTLQDKRSQSQRLLSVLDEISEDMDLDIFDGESENVGNVVSLKSTKNIASAILPSINTTKLRTPLTNDKRDRDQDDAHELPSSKKLKLTLDKVNTTVSEKNQEDIITGSDHVNDEIMGQVINNVDGYITNLKNRNNNMKQMNSLQINNPIKNMSQIIENNTSQKSFISNSISRKPPKAIPDEKYSENIFSVLENDSEILKSFDYKTQNQIPHHITNKSNTITDLEIMELCTPVEDDDSDKGVVENTPQKSTSFTKKKNKNETTIKNHNNINITMKANLKTKPVRNVQKNNTQDINVISLSDTTASTEKSKNITVLENEPRITLETPVTITKFVDQITHKSTPMARKSLNFNNENCDPELTICSSSFELAQTTQERQFLSKAFEHTLESEKCIRNNKVVKYCLAGSCLSTAEQNKVRFLCSEKKWTYVEKYTKDLTHLVVSVDEENKSKRSVKYMCALAGGKWIISYDWIEKCLQTNNIVDEEQFEALDGNGEPGPRRSRLAKRKLFTGISFYCIPPFSVLDVDTLKDILLASGGRVVSEESDARAGESPVLVLAKPEDTQEDRFIYLAMELSVVPVNYEWVLNCLGSYSLEPIYDLLLCPASLLPPGVAKWPPELITRDE